MQYFDLHFSECQFAKGTEFELKQGNLLTTLPKLGKAFEITYEVMAASLKDGSYYYKKSVFCMHSWYTSIACNFVYPRYDYHQSKTIHEMHIYSESAEQDDHEEISANKWIRVKVYQRADGQTEWGTAKYNYGIEIDDKTIRNITNNYPEDFTNVKVYAGDPNYDAIDGKIRHLCIRSK